LRQDDEQLSKLELMFFGEHGIEILAIDKLHRHKGDLLFLAQIVNHADVGMVERGGGPDDTIDLLENIGKSGRVFERIKLDDLDRYGATNHRVERLVDRPYRAFSDFLKNLKTTYRVLFFRHKQCTPTPPARRIPLELYLTPEIAARLSAPAWCKR